MNSNEFTEVDSQHMRFALRTSGFELGFGKS